MNPVDSLGADLYWLLREGQPDLVFSPFSVAAAMRLAWYGARGPTRDELTEALHLDQGTSSTSGPRPGDAFTFRMANTAWVQRGLPLDPEYARQLAGEEMTRFSDADFRHAPEQARAKINETIAEQTERKITDLLQPGAVTSDTRLVLANAVYLKGRWADPFPERDTAGAPFYPGGGRELEVPMMRGSATRGYKRGGGYQVVLLPYLNTTVAMAIVLPAGPLAALDLSEGIGGLLAGTTPHQVDLRLPKFRQETRLELVPRLRELGVRLAFTDDADFSGITAAEELHISAVAHQAYVVVDERGTEAAAATAVGMVAAAFRLPQSPVEMIVDRPFLFATLDTSTGTPLFLGTVTSPG